MIRPHPTQPDTYRVSVRRRPIGYVKQVHGTKGVRTTTQYTASMTWVPYTYWVAKDLDLKVLPKWYGGAEWGKYDSKRQAVQRVATHASTQPKPPEVSYAKFIDAWSEETDRLRNMDHSNRKWYETIYDTIRQDLEIVAESMYGFLSKLRGKE